jgi:hypothetical protein
MLFVVGTQAAIERTTVIGTGLRDEWPVAGLQIVLARFEIVDVG